MFTKCDVDLDDLRRASVKIIATDACGWLGAKLMDSTDVKALRKNLEHFRFTMQFSSSAGPFKGCIACQALWDFEIDCFICDDACVVWAGGQYWGWFALDCRRYNVAELYEIIGKLDRGNAINYEMRELNDNIRNILREYKLEF